MRQKTQSCFIPDSDSSPHTEVARVCVFSIYLLFTHVDNVHWCCSLSTDVWVLTHRKGPCRVLLHVSAAWSWRQHHDSDRCAEVFIISFVLTVLLSMRHVADIVSWLLHVLTHAGVRPTWGWTAGVRFSAEARDFSFLHSVQVASEAYPSPIRRVPGVLSSGVKCLGRDADTSI
jgi:hypothetical protein